MSRTSRVPTHLALLGALASACAPQSASLEVGDFTAFLSASRSITYQKGNLKLDEFGRFSYVDCREFEDARNDTQNEELRLGDGPGTEAGQRLPICGDDPGVGADQWPPEQEPWLDEDGYAVVGDVLDPWRGEAIITSEGDVQFTFHNRLPGGEDMWFAFVIDPNFQPRQCVQNEAGDGVEFKEVDGNWVEQWTGDLDDDETGTLYYLNSGSYQLDPVSVNKYVDDPYGVNIQEWFLPNEWASGHAQGQFGDDLFTLRTAKYGRPSAYWSYQLAQNSVNELAAIDLSDLYYWPSQELTTVPEAQGDGSGRRCLSLEDCREEANTDARTLERELRRAGLPAANEDGTEVDDLPSFRPRVHDNDWRTPDESAAGLDGWIELHSNWVRFDEGAVLEKGGAATGEFHLVFEGTESTSRFFIRGKFAVDSFKKDTWTTKYLPAIKFEQNGTTECGMPPE
jgi:hypothetical protein